MNKNYKVWYTNMGTSVAGVLLDTKDGSSVVQDSSLTSVAIGTIKTVDGNMAYNPLYITRFIKDCPTEAEIIKNYQEEVLSKSLNK